MWRSRTPAHLGIVVVLAWLVAAACLPPYSTRKAQVDVNVFHSTLSEFQGRYHSSSYRTNPSYSWMNFTNDGCSSSPDSVPFVYNFTHPCHHHDYGYRNYKLLNRDYPSYGVWNETLRSWVDSVFLSDMRSTCSGLTYSQCMETAQVFYQFVRLFGS